MKGDYLFPFQLALTELCSDFLLYSKFSKRTVLLELTCLCKENKESWHSQMLNKYTPLAKVIEDNGWTVDLFPVEVGAQGYSSRSLSICLKRLGYNNKIVQKTTKSLSSISMKASFYIWLARNSSSWSSNISLITIEDANFPPATSKNTNPYRDSRSSNAAPLSSNIAPLSSQPTKGSVINTLNTLAFSTRLTLVVQTQFYKLWAQSHQSGVSQLPSQVSYYPWLEQ